MKKSPHTVFIKILCLICALAMLFSFVACNGEDDAEVTDGAKYHTVSFNTNGGSPIESIQVLDGYYASRPEDPTMDNYVFRRWELDNREWHFGTKRVTESITLNALWVSAIELFAVEPDEKSDGLLISDFKKASSFSTLKVPEIINGKKIVGLADEAFENTGSDYASLIVLPESVVTVGNYAFANSTEIKFDIKGTLTSIGVESFRNCALLDKISLGVGITSIPFMAFYNCSSLKTIALPDGVTTVEENAFEKCSSLVTIVIPASLTTIEDSGFSYCPSLKTVFYKGTQEQLDAIDVADGNEAFLDAKVYFYSEAEPTEDGLWWHYDNSGSPVIW